MRAQKTLRRWSSAVVVVFFLAACGGAEPGSREDLRSQVDAIDLPSALVELGDSYDESCPGSCPNFVVWYQVTAPLEEVRVELVDALTDAAWELDQAGTSGVYSARKEEHMLFLVVDQQMLARNPIAPHGTNVEISVHVLDRSPD